MTDKPRKFVNYTPVGTLNYPRLNKPDVPTKFKGKPNFQTELILEKGREDVEKFIANLKEKVLSKLDAGDKFPLRETEDAYIIRVKKLAEYGPPRFYTPNADGSQGFTELEKAPGLVWSGTKAGVSFTTTKYAGGITFNLTGVTIHELVEPEKVETTATTEATAATATEDIFK